MECTNCKQTCALHSSHERAYYIYLEKVNTHRCRARALRYVHKVCAYGIHNYSQLHKKNVNVNADAPVC